MRGVLVCALGLLVVLGVAGCGGDGDQALPVCDRFCECRYDLPAFRDSCVEQCLADLPPLVDLPRACTSCLEEASCIELQSCGEVCGGDSPEEGF